MLPIFTPDSPVTLTKKPKIAVIILTKNHFDDLVTCVDSIQKQGYENIEYHVGDTGSNSYDYKRITKFCEKNNVDVHNIAPFHFSKNNNEIVNKHVSKDVEYLFFANNDIELLNNVIEQFLFAFENQPNVGTVGCQLFFYEGASQHMGVFCVQTGPYHYSYGHTGMWTHDFNFGANAVFGNTGAAMMIKKDLFLELGGFNEIYESVFQDVELNAQCIIKGLKNVYIGSAMAYHNESSSRKDDKEDGEKLRRDLSKINRFVFKHRKVLSPFIINYQENK
jgi:GT2 family glycosyltransferase